MYQIATKYTKWPKIGPNGHKIFQHLPLQDFLKFTQIGSFEIENIPSGHPGKKSNLRRVF
jgi:hypothetical protein